MIPALLVLSFTTPAARIVNAARAAEKEKDK